MNFKPDIFYGYLVRGKLNMALEYLHRFPEQAEQYDKYRKVFEQENYPDMSTDGLLNDVLLCYQRYYRDVFFLEMKPDLAAEHLRSALLNTLGLDSGSLDSLEEGAVKQSFESRGYHFQGGRTGGYYGPYVWRGTERAEYAVELPEGTGHYSLDILSGFVTKGWLDYISFGVVSTGGWSNGDGVLCCISDCYDFESEDFRVSLLKHEAQHELDIRRYGQISSAELEYRAKLVELIYSRERDMLARFALEADGSSAENGHGIAAKRIVENIPQGLESAQVRKRARELFDESCRAIGK